MSYTKVDQLKLICLQREPPSCKQQQIYQVLKRCDTHRVLPHSHHLDAEVGTGPVHPVYTKGRAQWIAAQSILPTTFGTKKKNSCRPRPRPRPCYKKCLLRVRIHACVGGVNANSRQVTTIQCTNVPCSVRVWSFDGNPPPSTPETLLSIGSPC
ncbi:hypothetical protein LZ32DRAFT_396147 [Colletotrichum eremochloae]|nr:hypothetical protein LZ32DRAFT_396147 [Colletotrichum eremochloae]